MVIVPSITKVYIVIGVAVKGGIRKKENNLTGADISVYSLIPYHVLSG